MKNRKLDDLRAEIDEIDDRIVDLLDQRVAKAALVGAAKMAAGLSQVFVPEREAVILQRLGRKPLKNIKAKELEKIYRQIFSVCRKVQANDKIPALAKKDS